MKKYLFIIILALATVSLWAQNKTPKPSIELNMGYVPKTYRSPYSAFHNLSPSLSVYCNRLKFGFGADWVNYKYFNYFGYYASIGWRAFSIKSWEGYVNAMATFYPWMSGEKTPTKYYYDMKVRLGFTFSKNLNDHFHLNITPVVKYGKITQKGDHSHFEDKMFLFGCEIGLEYRF